MPKQQNNLLKQEKQLQLLKKNNHQNPILAIIKLVKIIQQLNTRNQKKKLPVEMKSKHMNIKVKKDRVPNKERLLQVTTNKQQPQKLLRVETKDNKKKVLYNQKAEKNKQSKHSKDNVH
jgi:hypothetical protein